MEDQTKSSPEGNAEEITSDYANNVYFVASIWDLKILFGELGTSNREVDWHTSITLPWAQVKIMSYYLQVNIALHESNNGRIKVPPTMIPPNNPDVMFAAPMAQSS